MLGGIAKDAGLAAAQEAHKALDGGINQAHEAADELVDRVTNQIVAQTTGALTQAVGSLCTALGDLPAFIGNELDGFTIEISPITVTIKRRAQ